MITPSKDRDRILRSLINRIDALQAAAPDFVAKDVLIAFHGARQVLLALLTRTIDDSEFGKALSLTEAVVRSKHSFREGGCTCGVCRPAGVPQTAEAGGQV